jgi:hypothetical protein
LLVLSIFSSEVGCIVSEIVSLHVLATFGSSILTFFLCHNPFKCLFLKFQLLDGLLLLLLLLGKHGSGRLKDGQLVIYWRVLLELVFKRHAIFLKPFHIIGKSLKFTLSGHWFLEKKFNSLESFPFVIQLSSQNFVVEFTILPCFISQILQHLVRSKVLVGHLLGIHKSLFDG